MRWNPAAAILVAAAAVGTSATAHTGGSFETPGSLVEVSVEVAGQPAPLYPAPDGSGRYYLEAREGCRYQVRLTNRTGERLGVVLTVDGLNVISGTRDRGRGRMYVLDPWGHATVKGWRTSLEEVRRFTFVDEKTSYAARSGQANSRMGWIEVTAYRERRLRFKSQVQEDAPASLGIRDVPNARFHAMYRNAAASSTKATNHRVASADTTPNPSAATSTTPSQRISMTLV